MTDTFVLEGPWRAGGRSGCGRALRSAGALLAVAATFALAAGAAAAAVTVFPSPGSRLASPQTQIALRGVPMGQLGAITVRGSRTGVHTGHLSADSDGQGASFLPDRAFAASETVTVTTQQSVVGASGTTYTFQVASPAGGFADLHWPPAARTSGDIQHFASRPDLTPVTIKVTHAGASGDGDIFIAPQWGPVQDGPMILDPQGRVVWFDRMRGNDMASNFQVQHYEGQSVLTWWQGFLHPPGVGVGEDVIFDRNYHQVALVKAANGQHADEHEFLLTKANTALIDVAYPVYWNASAVHGAARQVVLDDVVQEIDIPTGLVLFQWDSLDHIPLSDSHQAVPRSAGTPYDAYHLNSIDVDHDGNLLLSVRNTWDVVKVNSGTGRIMWTLGGKRSSFHMGTGTRFAWQHDARVRANSDEYLTIFDDESSGLTAKARVLKLRLDTSKMTATVAQSLGHSPALGVNYEGNLQQLPNFNEFVGWGAQPYFTEYNTRGNVVFEARMVGNNASYRAYRFRWSATPESKPSVAGVTKGSRTKVSASWNGATAVARWRVLGGSSGSSLHTVTTVGKNGFETAVGIAARRYIQVQALSASGTVLGTSPVAAASG